MRAFVARRSLGALAVLILALVLAMGGAGYGASGSDNAKDRAIANAAAKKYFNHHIGSASVAHATNADNATQSTTATNATQLGGVAASGYTVRDCNAQAGAIKGWAFVNASASFSSTFVAVPGYNCSGGAVQAKRFGVGLYEVQFVNSPVTVMVATVNGGSSPSGFVDSHNNGPGDFIIGTRNTSGALEDGHGFALITP